MQTSREGIDLIKQFEGLRLDAYLDTAGVWTIGWGDTKDVYPGMHITLAEAERRLRRRLAEEFEPAIRRAIDPTPFTQAQADAMASLCYNIGIGAFRHSTVVRMHRLARYWDAGDAFLMWKIVKGRVDPGLLRRRQVERALYLSDIPQ